MKREEISSLEKLRKDHASHFMHYNYPRIMGLSRKEFLKRIPEPITNNDSILVIPENHLLLRRQLQLVGIESLPNLQSARTRLKEIKIPDRPYWINNVHVFVDIYIGKKGEPTEAEKIKAKGFRPLTLTESVAFFVHQIIFGDEIKGGMIRYYYTFPGEIYHEYDDRLQDFEDKIVGLNFGPGSISEPQLTTNLAGHYSEPHYCTVVCNQES